MEEQNLDAFHTIPAYTCNYRVTWHREEFWGLEVIRTSWQKAGKICHNARETWRVSLDINLTRQFLRDPKILIGFYTVILQNKFRDFRLQ